MKIKMESKAKEAEYLGSLKEKLNRSFFILDKPSGPTSHKAAMLVRNLLKIDKVGHGGTLDPKVTGVLVLGLGNAARLLRVLHSDKKYRGVMHLHADVSIENIKKIIDEKYLGKIKQIPPKHSQVKRVEREREIYFFNILSKKDKDVEFEVHCEKGTYIRKLIYDLGSDLYGAHMSKLRRISHGNFSEDLAITLEKLKEAIENKKVEGYLIPIEKALLFLTKIEIKKEFIKKILNGSPIFRNYINKVEISKCENKECNEILESRRLKSEIYFALWHNKQIIGVYRKEKDKFMAEAVLH